MYKKAFVLGVFCVSQIFNCSGLEKIIAGFQEKLQKDYVRTKKIDSNIRDQLIENLKLLSQAVHKNIQNSLTTNFIKAYKKRIESFIEKKKPGHEAIFQKNYDEKISKIKNDFDKEIPFLIESLTKCIDRLNNEAYVKTLESKPFPPRDYTEKLDNLQSKIDDIKEEFLEFQMQVIGNQENVNNIIKSQTKIFKTIKKLVAIGKGSASIKAKEKKIPPNFYENTIKLMSLKYLELMIELLNKMSIITNFINYQAYQVAVIEAMREGLYERKYINDIIRKIHLLDQIEETFEKIKSYNGEVNGFYDPKLKLETLDLRKKAVRLYKSVKDKKTDIDKVANELVEVEKELHRKILKHKKDLLSETTQKLYAQVQSKIIQFPNNTYLQGLQRDLEEIEERIRTIQEERISFYFLLLGNIEQKISSADISKTITKVYELKKLREQAEKRVIENLRKKIKRKIKFAFKAIKKRRNKKSLRRQRIERELKYQNEIVENETDIKYMKFIERDVDRIYRYIKRL
jgi:hypothetical protein